MLIKKLRFNKSNSQKSNLKMIRRKEKVKLKKRKREMKCYYLSNSVLRKLIWITGSKRYV